MMVKLKQCDKAPNFSGSDQHGNSLTLEDFSGSAVILFFYPQDCISDCSGGCALRNNFGIWAYYGYNVICVCNNNFEEHRKFIQQRNLPFTLIADPSKRIANKYGVWDMDEQTGSLLHAAFVISRDGFIEKIITDGNKNKYIN